jgi:hypothetical protein
MLTQLMVLSCSQSLTSGMLGRVWPTAHMVAGAALVGFAVPLYLLAGFGFNEDEPASWLNYAPVPLLAVFAVPRFFASWRSFDRRGMLSVLVITCATLAVATVVLDYVTEPPCNPSPADPRVDHSPCFRTPLWAAPIATILIFLGRLALAAPMLAARRPITLVGAVVLFLLGSTVGIIPSPIPSWTDGGTYLRLRGSVLAMVGLGAAYVAMGVADLKARGLVVVPDADAPGPKDDMGI